MAKINQNHSMSKFQKLNLKATSKLKKLEITETTTDD